MTATSSQSEQQAIEIIERLGGQYRIEPRFGLDCLGVVVEVCLVECSPSSGDLDQIKRMQHLRVLDLSRTPIGDRELLQLVDCPCPFVIVPDGQTSEEARQIFGEDRIAIGVGVSEFVIPGVTSTSLPAAVARTSEQNQDKSAPWAAKRTRAKRRRI